MKLIFDLESNGLLTDVDTIWCICTYDLVSKLELSFKPDEIEDGIKYLDSAEELIGHNIIFYDIPVIRKLYPGYRLDTKTTDTLILSRLFNPDRPGGHSLDAWGSKLGIKKPEHEDWSQYSEEMLHRCKEDVKINTDLYYKLLEEQYED